MIRATMIALVAICLVGCAEIYWRQCRPQAPEIIVNDKACQFSAGHPTACLGELWIKAKCPLEL